MKKTIRLALLITAISIGFTACKKDNPNPEPVPTTKTKTQMLTAKVWKPISGTHLQNGTRVDSQLSEEEKKDQYIFKSDKSFSFIEYRTGSTAPGSGSFNGTWVFTNNESQINITIPAGVVPMIVLSLTDDQLELENQVSKDQLVLKH